MHSFAHEVIFSVWSILIHVFIFDFPYQGVCLPMFLFPQLCRPSPESSKITCSSLIQGPKLNENPGRGKVNGRVIMYAPEFDKGHTNRSGRDRPGPWRAPSDPAIQVVPLTRMSEVSLILLAINIAGWGVFIDASFIDIEHQCVISLRWCLCHQLNGKCYQWLDMVTYRHLSDQVLKVDLGRRPTIQNLHGEDLFNTSTVTFLKVSTHWNRNGYEIVNWFYFWRRHRKVKRIATNGETLQKQKVHLVFALHWTHVF